MTEEHQKLLKDIQDYLNANSFKVADLKDLMLNFGDKPANSHFKTALRASIDNSSIGPDEFTAASNMLFETQEEVDEWLTEIWEYIYEDGPIPED